METKQGLFLLPEVTGWIHKEPAASLAGLLMLLPHENIQKCKYRTSKKRWREANQMPVLTGTVSGARVYFISMVL